MNHAFKFASLCFLIVTCSAQADAPIKTASSLYPESIAAQVRANANAMGWVAKARDQIVLEAQRWMEKSDEELWEMMFGPGITRTWMVWSNGFCPACKQSVPMYTWKMDAMGEPWKTRCPHCNQAFPTNDFAAFYRSGLNEQGIFDPARADRSLLFNAEHPETADPLHLFGVDDGEGYAEGENRWRFIGAYLIYGQWKQAVLNGIRVLSAAYLLTGDAAFAHKAGILLDRVADVYPTFDFAKQALVYEVPGVAGYVSTWHDACEETRELAMSYDMIFEGLRADTNLVPFLSQQAARYHLDNPKQSFADIQRNIEDRILRDAITNRAKIKTNYPRTEIAIAIMLAVLGWPENKAAFYEVVDPMLDRATAVDGVTGEKGLAGYSCYTIQAMALFLAEFSKADPAFLEELYRRQPRLKEMYRFHIDTQCLGRYYPQSGDTGGFATATSQYVGMQFLKPGFSNDGFSAWTLVPPSCYTLLWRLYKLSGDPAFVQTAFRTNEWRPEDLPYDPYAEDGAAILQAMKTLLLREGMDIRLGSVNKQEWHLGILRSGAGRAARAVWLDYDSGGGHGHHDGLNLGFFAQQLDLMPEFGYPPVQFGGWNSPRARWYASTPAHNTVTVDGQNTANGAGETTLWADGRQFHAIRAAAPALNGGNRYERTVALVDLTPETCYAIDVFRVAGGHDHALFMQSHFGGAAATGLQLQPAPDYGYNTQMRNFQMDPAPQPGWNIDWTIEDRLGSLEPGQQPPHLRYTGLTSEAQAGLAEAWLVVGGYNASEETWIPRMVVRRQVPEGESLASAFVGVIEPYETQPNLSNIVRLAATGPDGTPLPDTHAALSIALPGGRRDIALIRDPESPGVTFIPGDPEIQTDAELCLVRLDAKQRVELAVLCRGQYVSCPGLQLNLPAPVNFMEYRGE